MRTLLLASFFALSLSLLSCDDDGLLGDLFYHVDIVNNTDLVLDIYENIDNTGFFIIANDLDPGESHRQKAFEINVRYELEARDASNGTVIADLAFEQETDDDRTWTIEQ